LASDFISMAERFGEFATLHPLFTGVPVLAAGAAVWAAVRRRRRR